MLEYTLMQRKNVMIFVAYIIGIICVFSFNKYVEVLIDRFYKEAVVSMNE